MKIKITEPEMQVPEVIRPQLGEVYEVNEVIPACPPLRMNPLYMITARNPEKATIGVLPSECEVIEE